MSKLVLVGIETTLGAPYTFPDMDSEIFDRVLLNDEMWRRLGSLVLTNASGSCLVIPVQIIQRILVDGELRWTASTA